MQLNTHLTNPLCDWWIQVPQFSHGLLWRLTEIRWLSINHLKNPDPWGPNISLSQGKASKRKLIYCQQISAIIYTM